MAFVLANLNPIGGQSKVNKTLTAGALGRGAPAMWSYTTEDAHATVDGAGYFNSSVAYGGAYNLLSVGDLIYVFVLSSGALSTAGFHVVKDKASGTIDVTDVTVITVTDSD
jgi:hypothetical protein